MSSKIASIRSPLFQAITRGLFTFPNRDAAFQKLEAIRDIYETSSQLPKAKEGHVVLWIKGYDVSAEEVKAGYLGHYAELQPVEREDGSWFIVAKRLDVALSRHPQKQREEHRHPDWGHPILKAVKKATTYPSVKAAGEELAKLHRDYPETSIPTGPELYIMIYEKESDPSVQRYILRIEPDGEKGVVITAERNRYRQEMEQTEAESEPEGSFAARVALEQARKAARKLPPKTGKVNHES